MRAIALLLVAAVLNFNPPTVETAPHPKQVRKIHTVAVGVDINDSSCDNAFTGDATNIATILKSDNIFINDQATKENVLKAIADLKPDPNDLVVVFFSAHGEIDKDYYIMLHGSGGDDWKKHVLWGKELKNALNKLPCPSILALDTCCAGAMLRHKMDKTIVLAACMAEESSYGEPGPFAVALQEGLEGKADYDEDGTVTAYELSRYVKFYTAKYAESWQTPETRIPKKLKYLTIP